VRCRERGKDGGRETCIATKPALRLRAAATPSSTSTADAPVTCRTY
jgi:hypothetical protein